MSRKAPFNETAFDNSDEGVEDREANNKLDELLLLNEITCDVNIRDTYFMKLYEFYNKKQDEVMAACCQTLGIANGIEMNFPFVKRNSFDFFEEFQLLQLGVQKWSNATEMLQSRADSFKKSLKELPDEWNIIQMSREVNLLAYGSVREDIIRNNSPIYLTLLKYPYWEYNEWNPICIKIHPNPEFNIYEETLDFLTEYSKLFVNEKDPGAEQSRKAYAELMKSLKENMNKLISNLKARLGPLVQLFQGKPKVSTKEDVFFKRLVKTFGKILTKRQLILIFLFTRRCPDESDGKFVEYIDPIEESVLSQLNLFLSEFKQRYPINVTCDHFPCIMIIDENLDQLPWEMILPSQEFTRLISFGILEKLHTKYKSQMRNGYLVKKISHGNWIINPDNDLPSMEKRMVAFSKYFRPEWKPLVQTVPSSEECKELLKCCDAYIYSGHGSGLKFLRGRHLIDLELDCIVFLFGCSSVALTSTGHNNSMIGPHVYYHLAHCPTILGNIFTVTDFNMDFTTAIILTRFMATNNNCVDDFMSINRKEWQNGKFEFMKKKKVEPEYNLNKLVASIRCNEDIAITMRAAIVLRGLPLFNDLIQMQ